MKQRFHTRIWDWLSLAGAYLLSACALLWRRLMFRTTFIAVTGSVGKSTAVACLGTTLSRHYRTNWDRSGRNHRAQLARLILRTRPWHRFTVIEVGTRAPGALRRAAWMIDPDIVLMLRVLNVHSDAFPALADMAAEKARLLSRMGSQGVAVLNADDEMVSAMGRRFPGRVVTFGRSAGSDFMASDVAAAWPARLSFRVRHGSEQAEANTNLVGEHFLNSALGAIATAVECGVALPESAADLSYVDPVTERMQPRPLPSGATAICDTYNATLPALQASLRFLEQASATRRFAVVGDILDTGLAPRARLRDVARRVGAAADFGIFIGDQNQAAANVAREAGRREKSAAGFANLRQAAAFLRSELRPGDLVLIQAWESRHMERIALAQSGEIGCWITRCYKRVECAACPELKLVPFDAPVQVPSWYLDPLTAAQKRDVHQRWIRGAVGSRSRRVVFKSDLFEEAYGSDRLLDDLFADAQCSIGADLNERTVRAASQRAGGKFQVLAGDVRKLPLAGRSVDVIVSNSTLDHFDTKEEIARSVEEFARVLRPGGVLLVTLDNPWNPLYYAVRGAARRGWASFTLGSTVSAPRLRRLLSAAGLQVEATHYLIHNPRGVSTVLFLGLRKLLGARADAPIAALLRIFELFGELPTRPLTASFVAVTASKPAKSR